MENSSSKTVNTELLKEFTIQNYKNPRRKDTVVPLRESLNLAESDFEDIKEICNQPIVYEFIFGCCMQAYGV